MILGERYSIPPGGIVLKDRLQLGNMWRSDHLSRKRTRRVLRRGTTTHLALTCAPLSAVSPCARWDGPFMRDRLDFVEGARLPRMPRSQCQGVVRWLTENRRCYVRHVTCPHVRSHETWTLREKYLVFMTINYNYYQGQVHIFFLCETLNVIITNNITVIIIKIELVIIIILPLYNFITAIMLVIVIIFIVLYTKIYIVGSKNYYNLYSYKYFEA